MTAAAQNIKRMVKLLSNGRPKEEAIAAQSPLMASLRVSLSGFTAAEIARHFGVHTTSITR